MSEKAIKKIYDSIKGGNFSNEYRNGEISDHFKEECFKKIKFITWIQIKYQDDDIQAFYDQFSDPSIAFFHAHQLASGETPTIKSFDGLDTLELKHSFFSLPSINILRFTGKEDIYIFQNQSSIDGVWIPSQNICLQFQYFSRDTFQKIFFDFIDNFTKISSYFKSDARFHNLIASSSRPSHTFSNIAPVVNFLSEKFDNKISLSYFDNINMFSFSDVYDFISNEETLTVSYMQEDHFISGRFYYKIGIKFSELQKEHALLFDQKYRETTFATDHVQTFNSKLLNPDKVIWIGITGQKREWVEQIEGAVEAIKYFKYRYSRPFFIFDGWTSSIYSRDKNNKQVREDLDVVKSIVESLKQQGITIRSFSVVGLMSKEKVEIAKAVDFFVCNHGSGSLHVSRFAKKHGVTHLSNTFHKSHGEETIHYNALKVPDEYVVDISDETNRRPDFINYSIDPKKFVEVMAEYYESIEPLGASEKIWIFLRSCARRCSRKNGP